MAFGATITGGMQPGTYRMPVQVINAETDKPVRSNSMRFEESVVSGDPTCSIYECPCAVFGGCFGPDDPGVTPGGGYPASGQ